MALVRADLVASTLGYRPERLVEIDDGFDYEVVVADDAWVFRFPRRASVEATLALEIELLPLLHDALPVEVPRFEHVSRDPLFVAYPLIGGDPLVDEDPAGIAGFLSALHGIAPETLPLARPDWREEYVERCGRFAQSVVPLLDVDERSRAEQLFAEAAGLTEFDPVPIHADLLPEHMRCRHGRLAGVIDWGDACVGDPALDFAWLLHAHPHAEEVVAAYSGPLDDAYRERARFYYRLEPWVAARYGLVTAQPAQVDRGLRGIRERL